ncbi:hypothetical protein [Cupriavidus oxalaticus]|uniref:hypothetical protein n=1 Tax=Cupriavidus oxalaticus TaxID=96344 RepID=UPI001F0F00B5|nr:hypothetical protein [Cupriavidus oxalaticus]
MTLEKHLLWITCLRSAEGALCVSRVPCGNPLPLASEEFLAFLVGVPSWPFLVVLFAVNVGILLLDDTATLKWTKRCGYMQDGPSKLPEPYRFWAPRETFWEGYKICRGGKFSGAFWALSDFIFFPFALLDAFARWLVLATCSNPVWPPEIEAACKPTPCDPYARPYADDYIGVPSGPDAKPSREDLKRMWEQEPRRRREGALIRAEAEALLHQDSIGA